MARYAGGAEDPYVEFSHGTQKQASGWSALVFLVVMVATAAIVGRVLGLG